MIIAFNVILKCSEQKEILSNSNTFDSSCQTIMRFEQYRLFQNYYQTIQHFQRANQKRLTFSAFVSNYIDLFRALLPNNVHFVRVRIKQHYFCRELIQNNTHFLRIHIKLYNYDIFRVLITNKQHFFRVHIKLCCYFCRATNK